MPYYKKKITSGALTEYEIYYSRRQIGKRIPRCQNENSTDAEQQQRNWMNSYKKFRRKLHANFGSDDLFITFDFRDEVGFDEAAEEFRKFIRRLKREKKKRGEELKYMATVVDEQRGGKVRTHIHAALSKTDAELIWRLWTAGGARIERFEQSKEYTALVNYMTSQQKKRSGHQRWIQSRGLINPVEEVKEITRAQAERMLKVPRGYKELDRHLDVNDGGRYQYLSCYRLGGLDSSQVKKKMRYAERRVRQC